MFGRRYSKTELRAGIRARRRLRARVRRAAASKRAVLAALDPSEDGPLGSSGQSLPIYFDVYDFKPGQLRVDFGYEGRFIEGEVRTSECI